MLGIGYFDLSLEEDEREQLGTRLLFRPQFGMACSKKRKLSKRRKPILTFVVCSFALSPAI